MAKIVTLIDGGEVDKGCTCGYRVLWSDGMNRVGETCPRCKEVWSEVTDEDWEYDKERKCFVRCEVER